MSAPRKPSEEDGRSSANILKLLPKANAGVSLEEKGELIYVPQKCYGVITARTPQQIKGLYTTGINTCSGIVAIAKDTNDSSIYFCHADTRTNLLDENHGLLGWISKLPTSVTRIQLTYDDAENGYFKNLISRVINSVHSGKTQRQIVSNIREDDSVDMVVLRNERIASGGGIQYAFEEKDYTTNDDTIMFEYAGYLVRHHEGEHSPICVFDGEKLLSKDEIFANQSWLVEAVKNAITKEYANDSEETEKNRTVVSPVNNEQVGDNPQFK